VFDADAAHGAGVTAVMHKGRIVLIADTLVHEWPDAEDLATVAERATEVARYMGLVEPRVALVSFSAFGYPVSERAEKMHQGSVVLERRDDDECSAERASAGGLSFKRSDGPCRSDCPC